MEKIHSIVRSKNHIIKTILCLCLFSSLWVLTFSCRKKKAEDPEPTRLPVMRTIEPDAYLPAYPGSWWKYVDSKTKDTILSTTSASYVKDRYQNKDTYGRVTKSDSAYVPLCNKIPIWGGYGHFGPVYGAHNLQENSLIPIVSENFPVGMGWVLGGGSRGSHMETRGSVSKKDTSIQISGKTYSPTIIINNADYFEMSPLIILNSRAYYTKDIGMVKAEWFTINGTIDHEMTLVNYSILK